MKHYVKNLESYGAYGWEWLFNKECRFEGSLEEFEPVWVHYRTNDVGEGLFVEKDAGNWKQISGTCQFDLPLSKSGAYKKIIRELKNNYY